MLNIKHINKIMGTSIGKAKRKPKPRKRYSSSPKVLTDIFECVRKGVSLSFTEMTVKSGYAESTVRLAVTELKKAGKIKCDKQSGGGNKSYHSVVEGAHV